MSLINIERKYAWSFLGFILGTISLLIVIAVFYYSERKDTYDLNLTVEEEFNLIDLRERIPELQVLYQGENILKTHKEIKVLRISLRNNGKSILQTMYDINQKFGFIFKNSELLNFQIVESNSDYIHDNLNPIINSLPNDSNKNFLQLNKIIFESNKYVVLKIYLIQTSNIEKTEIEEVGKIAGIDKFKINKKTTITERPIVQVSVILYIVIGYFGLIGFLVLIVTIIARIDKRKLNRQLKSFVDTYPQYSNKTSLLKKLIKIRNFTRIAEAIVKEDNVINLESKKDQFIHLYKVVEKIYPTYTRQFFILPKEIFRVENDLIFLQEENKELIELFIKQINTNNKNTKSSEVLD